jgi:hypothetical protein
MKQKLRKINAYFDVLNVRQKLLWVIVPGVVFGAGSFGSLLLLASINHQSIHWFSGWRYDWERWWFWASCVIAFSWIGFLGAVKGIGSRQQAP